MLRNISERVIWLAVGMAIGLSLVVSFGCVRTESLRLPEMALPARPEIQFLACSDDKICFTKADTQALLRYMVTLETTVKNCQAVTDAINKEAK